LIFLEITRIFEDELFSTGCVFEVFASGEDLEVEDIILLLV